MAINLLPTSLVPKSSVIRFTEVLRSIITVGVVILLVGGVGALALVILNYIQLQSIAKRSQALSSSISSLEQTETKFVLVKDRLKKGKEILSESKSGDNLSKLSSLVLSLSPDLQVGDTTLEKGKFTVTLTTSNSTSLAAFMSAVVTDPAYKTIDLTDFSFSPTTGYLVSLSFF